jgi:hypothetical protein
MSLSKISRTNREEWRRSSAEPELPCYSSENPLIFELKLSRPKIKAAVLFRSQRTSYRNLPKLLLSSASRLAMATTSVPGQPITAVSIATQGRLSLGTAGALLGID